MNIYDTNESVELYDNRGIEMARKCIRRAKRECALRYLILLLLFALGMVDKILFPQIEIKLSSYILLYVICMFSMMGFRIFHNGIVAKRMKDFTLQEKHDYNLVIYRENHNKKFFLKSITLLTMAKQDILMEKPLAAKQALSQIAVESLGKNVLKTYYFLLAAASFRAREDSCQIELEHCSAVPSKTVKLSDDELQEIFRSGDQTRLMDTVKTWEIMAEQDTKTEPYLNLWFGILMAATAIGYGIWTFVVGSSDSYYNFMLIGATLLLVGLWILVSVRIVYLLRRSQNKGKGLGKKKGIRFLTLFILVLMWCFIVGLSLVIFVGAGSDIHTQWEAMKTGKQQESQDETYHNGTEISTEADIKNQETENTEMASEIIEDTDADNFYSKRTDFIQLDGMNKTCYTANSSKIYESIRDFIKSNLFCGWQPSQYAIKNDFIKRNNIIFSTKYQFGEDKLFFFSILENVKKICVTNLSLSLHRIRREGAATNNVKYASIAQSLEVDAILFQSSKHHSIKQICANDFVFVLPRLFKFTKKYESNLNFIAFANSKGIYSFLTPKSKLLLLILKSKYSGLVFFYGFKLLYFFNILRSKLSFHPR